MHLNTEQPGISPGRKVFLDIGAHHGETARAALEFDFDIVHCFEPAAAARRVLAELHDPRVRVHAFALGARSGEQPLYHARSSQGSSLYAQKRNVSAESFELCSVRTLSDWFAEHIEDTDLCIAKINAEGAEVEILQDLERNSLLPRFAYMVVYPDISKVSDHAEAGLAEFARITRMHPQVLNAKEVFQGVTKNPHRRIRYWLARLPELQRRS